LRDLCELYGIDPDKGGGRWWVDLVVLTSEARRYGYTVRDVAAAWRRQNRISPVVHLSVMRRACWQLFEARAAEWEALQIEPAATVYDLTEHVVDVIDGPAPGPDSLAVLEALQKLGIFPTGPSKPG
jgi:hypothetical protein